MNSTKLCNWLQISQFVPVNIMLGLNMANEVVVKI
jgi:hypothetical protein